MKEEPDFTKHLMTQSVFSILSIEISISSLYIYYLMKPSVISSISSSLWVSSELISCSGICLQCCLCLVIAWLLIIVVPSSLAELNWSIIPDLLKSVSRSVPSLVVALPPVLLHPDQAELQTYRGAGVASQCSPGRLRP